MTLAARAEAFATAYAKWPASHLRVVREQGREVLYGVWVIGNDYRNRSRYYGSYPPGYLDRVMALFPDAGKVLHVFSGSLPKSPHYVTVDIRSDVGADLCGSVYDIQRLVGGPGHEFELVVADPPYTAIDASRYGTAMIDRQRTMRALASVTRTGRHLAWLDTTWPMHSKRQWVTVGRILVQRSTNHRVRVLTLFERVKE